MDHVTHGHRRRWIALAAAAGLCAGLAGCTSSSPPAAVGSTASDAPNGPGQWSTAQKASAQVDLEGPPVNEGAAQ